MDFIFHFFYSLFLFTGRKILSANYSGAIQNAVLMLANGAILAELFDIMENAGMLFTLHGFINNTVLLLTTTFSNIKWILALAAVAYLLIFGTAYLIKMKKNETKYKVLN